MPIARVQVSLRVCCLFSRRRTLAELNLTHLRLETDPHSVALSKHMMDGHKMCGGKIGIWPPGKKDKGHWAMVIDTCADCKRKGITVSEGLWKLFKPEEQRMKVTWRADNE